VGDVDDAVETEEGRQVGDVDDEVETEEGRHVGDVDEVEIEEAETG
jgi:sporulation protein YlmC with PRC-barrel domain